MGASTEVHWKCIFSENVYMGRVLECLFHRERGASLKEKTTWFQYSMYFRNEINKRKPCKSFT